MSETLGDIRQRAGAATKSVPTGPEQPALREATMSTERDELRGMLSNSICNASLYPKRAQPHLLGGDMSDVLDRTADNLIAAGYGRLAEMTGPECQPEAGQVSTIAEVLAAHQLCVSWEDEASQGITCLCGLDIPLEKALGEIDMDSLAAHQVDALTKAGCGNLGAAWDEGWSAGAGWPQDDDNPYRSES